MIKIQARVRGYLTLRRFKEHIKRQDFHDHLDAAKYFTREEGKETLRPESVIAICDMHEMPESRGMYTYHCSGATYLGHWLGGMRHGEGRMTWRDGATYEGTWYCNQASMYGRFTYPNGDIYEGSWASNLMCGYGVYRHQKGTVYRGQWFQGMMHGKGEETWIEGSQYLGDYVDG